MRPLNSTSRLLFQRLTEKLRSKRKCSDTRIQKRDATYMLRISPLIPPKSNFMNYLVLMDKLNQSNFSKRKERQYMLLSAINHQRKLQKQRLNFIRNHSMENNCISIITKSKKSERHNTKRSMIRLASRTIRNPMLMFLISSENLKF